MPKKEGEGNFISPLRVYMKEKENPGLTMSRSFGYYYVSIAGIIPMSDANEYKLNPEDKFFDFTKVMDFFNLLIVNK